MNFNEEQFSLPAKTIHYWNKIGIKPIRDFDIALLERCLDAKPATSYISFMTKFGSTEFGNDIANEFSYYDQSGQQKLGIQVIGHIKSIERSLRYYEGLKNDNDLRFPIHLFPFAMDLGQGELLIEFGMSTERIFYWDFDNHNWENSSMQLHFVADNMYELINNLR